MSAPRAVPNRRRIRIIAVGVIAAAVTALAWPARQPEVADAPAASQRFVWGNDSLWSALEASFAESRADGCADERAARAATDSVAGTLAKLSTARVPANAPALDSLEDAFFRLGTRAAACGALANDYIALQGRLRETIKWQSTAWDLTAREVRDRRRWHDVDRRRCTE